jgi:hypothetical protein
MCVPFRCRYPSGLATLQQRAQSARQLLPNRSLPDIMHKIQALDVVIAGESLRMYTGMPGGAGSSSTGKRRKVEGGGSRSSPDLAAAAAATAAAATSRRPVCPHLFCSIEITLYKFP